MIKNSYYFILIIYHLLYGCQPSTSKNYYNFIDEYNSSISNINEIQIKFPENLINLNKILLETESEFLILKLIGTECVSCFNSMEDWKEFILNNKFSKRVKIVFIAEGEINDYFKNALLENNYPFNIFVDTTSTFSYKNGIEQYTKGTFLLNNEFKIVATGCPIKNKDIFNLYNYIIN